MLSQVRTYLLLRSILWQLAAIAEGLRPDLDEDDGAWSSTKGSGSSGGSGNTAAAKQQQREAAANDPGCWGPRDILVAGLCTLRLLRANMYYLRAAGVSPGTVGLGTSSGGSSSGVRREGGVDQRSPFASGLLSLLLDYSGGVLDVVPDGEGGDAEEELEEEEGGEEMDSLRRAVRYEAAEVVGQGLEVFLPEAEQKIGFLTALFRLGLGGDADADQGEESGESKVEGELEESKGWGQGGSRRPSSSDDVGVAAAAAMADGPLPVDMDEEGCAALISGVCNAVCADSNLLLSLVPEAVRPALTTRDVPSYVAAAVRSAEKAQAQALQQQMLKEAAAASSSTTNPGATTPSGGGGGTRGSTSSPRLTVPRGRGVAREEGDAFELWKSGPKVDLPRAGDVVVRGPDWAWGEQDGDAAGRGLVVGLATWGQAARAGGSTGRGGARGGGGVEGAEGAGSTSCAVAPAERNAVRVMWEKGAINVYRWGAADPCDPAGGKLCYDLKVLRAPVLAPDEPPPRGDGAAGSSSDVTGRKGGPGGKTKGQQSQGGGGGAKGRSGRGELKWSVEEVEAALLPLEGGGRRGGSGGDVGAPTTREVLRFIKNNAPQEWREPRRITGAENALVKVTRDVYRCQKLFLLLLLPIFCYFCRCPKCCGVGRSP